jgi:hypothetical protein
MSDVTTNPFDFLAGKLHRFNAKYDHAPPVTTLLAWVEEARGMAATDDDGIARGVDDVREGRVADVNEISKGIQERDERDRVAGITDSLVSLLAARVGVLERRCNMFSTILANVRRGDLDGAIGATEATVATPPPNKPTPADLAALDGVG